MTTQISVPAASQAMPSESPIRVMLVDDSAVVRSLMVQVLASDPDITVAASAANGQLAVQLLRSSNVQVILLDIEMPVMDGLTAIPKLLEIDPKVKIIIASTLTQRNAEISLKAMGLGAVDYIAKPTSPRDIGLEGDFRRELLAKIKSHGMVRVKRPKPEPAADLRVRATSSPAPRPAQATSPIALRKPGLNYPKVLAIGSSTGGPQALLAFLRNVPKTIGVPIIVTQHMPATFTAVLAQHLEKACGWPCKEGFDGAVLSPGTIHVAPGGYHMVIEGSSAQLTARLTQTPPENFCRPSVDPMMHSLVKAVGGHVLAVMLTGMGNDGLSGFRKVVDAGGTVIAQDEETSVVWGMPGAVATAGICAAVLPLPELAPYVVKFFEKTKL